MKQRSQNTRKGPGRPQGLSRVGFLQTCMGSGCVPVGAGEVGMWGGDPCGRPRPCRWKDEGRPQGSPPNPSPPPPLRGQWAFSPKNLPVKGPQGSPLPYSERSPLIVVLGPTASGKSTLGIVLAQRFNGEIVSADSRQVYRGLDIGTAKVSPEERALVPHHLLDVADVQEIYTVAQFRRQAITAIDDIVARGHLPLLVGGSPHYIQAVVDNLDIPSIPPQPDLRAELEARSLPDLLAQLEQLDPAGAASIDRNNPRRVIRALEVCLVSGKPFSEQKRMAAPLYNSLLLGIHWPREVLYQRIDMRVDERMQQGMVQEVRNLLEQGISHERLEALGLEYRFISSWLRGEFASEAEMVQRLKYAIHDFTRRQLTWFRKDSRITWLEGVDVNRAEVEVRRFLQLEHSNHVS